MMTKRCTAKSLLILLEISFWMTSVRSKWVVGHLQTTANWAFLSRFCFLSYEGQFEYQIEFNRDQGVPNLLLYYDDESQWPSVYHSNKSCTERENVLNKAGQNQMIPLSHWYPDNDFSGCVLKPVDSEPPNASSTQKPKTSKRPNKSSRKNNTDTNRNISTEDPRYYDQFLVTTKSSDFTEGDVYSTTPMTRNFTGDEMDFEIFENIEENPFRSTEGINRNDSDILSNLQDVEQLFDASNENGHAPIRKRSAMREYNRDRIKKFNPDPPRPTGGGLLSNKKQKLVVICHNMRRFRSVRERWWFIAISNCAGNKGLDVKYKFLMTNGPPGDYWHEHFSADEFYVLPILMAFCFAYIFMILAIVMCSVELKTRQMLHTTYKLFVTSVCLQEGGILLQSLAYVKYAVNGIGSSSTKTFGQLLCGFSEISYLLLLVLMAKGYTITRARLKVGYTVKLTVFICSYFITFVTLFIYQAYDFDPGEVLYLYESPAGYGLIVLRICAWFMFIYAIIFTIKKYPEKSVFYYPFSLCGTMWFYAGPLFILTANNYIDKWVRESVVIAVLLFITFCGHITFLLLTLPTFANKNFPYHVRTTQIGVMEVTGVIAGNSTVDHFGHNIYEAPDYNMGVTQSVIIPLTRRTEELLESVHQYLPSAPALHTLSPYHGSNQPSNGTAISYISGNNTADSFMVNNIGPKLSVSTQHSTESSSNEKVHNTHENQSDSLENRFIPETDNDDKKIMNGNPDAGISQNGGPSIFLVDNNINNYSYKEDPNYIKDINNPFLVGASMRAKKSLLEPLKKDNSTPLPWTIAKSQIVKNKEEPKNKMNGDYKLQGVIGTFPLPQIPRSTLKDKSEIKEEPKDENNSIVVDKDSSNEDSIQILQTNDYKDDETTSAIYSTNKEK